MGAELKKKERLKNLMSDLSIDMGKLGATVEDRASIIVQSISTSMCKEIEMLSSTGYKDLLDTLSEHCETFLPRLRGNFSLEESVDINVDTLKAIGVNAGRRVVSLGQR